MTAAPAPLCRQAQAAAGLFAGVHSKFKDEKALTPARLSRKLHESLRGSFRRAAARLCDATDQAVWAAEETERFGFPADADVVRMSARLRDAAAALEQALLHFSRAEQSAELLIEAKKHASEAERLHRGQRKQAHEDPQFVDGLKREGIARRLSDAAEGLQRAVDAVGEALAAR
jgi:hypothetical protein